MVELISHRGAKSPASFYDKAARYALLTPFATFALLYALLRFLPASKEVTTIQVMTAGAFLIQIINVIFGIVVCLNIDHHRRKLSIWMAVLAILASCCVGFLALMGYVLSNMGHGC